MDKDKKTVSFLGLSKETEKVDNDAIIIENLQDVIRKVKELRDEKSINPTAIQEEDAGMVLIEGEPMMIIENKYVPYEDARIVLQTRKVVSEYLTLQELITNKKNYEQSIQPDSSDASER